jgi:hypothetical protein
VSVEIDTERVRHLAADLRTQRDAVSAGAARCVALTLPGAGASVAAVVSHLVMTEQVLSETVAAAADACAQVLDDTSCAATVADRYR